jgi:hypothetical protein
MLSGFSIRLSITGQPAEAKVGGEPNQAFSLLSYWFFLHRLMRQQLASVLQSIPREMDMPAIIRMHKTTLGSSRNRQARIPDRLDHTSEDLQSRPIAIRSKGFTQALGLKIVYLD